MSSTRRFVPVFAAALALAAGACASLRDDAGSTARAPLPTEQFKITVDQAPDQLALAPHASGLSANQSAALGEFAARWRDAGQGDIAIRTPDRGDAIAISRSAAAAQEALEGLGVPRRMMRTEVYVADAAPAAPLVISYQAYAAKGPDCQDHWDNLTSTGSNKPSAHFGCAVTANFAAQIANPRDLQQPAPSEPGDATRRSTVLGAYRKGELTSTKSDDQANGAVSRVVQ